MTSFNSHVITNTILLVVFLSCSIILFGIVISRNPIKVIILLIGFFFNIFFMLTLLGADYIAILILLLYAGAVSIILLFVVMLLDMKDIVIYVEKYSSFYKILFAIFLFIINFIVINEYSYVLDFLPRVQYVNWFKVMSMKTNIEVVGLVIFELYPIQFLFIGLSLFVVTILIISLIVNYNFKSKKQYLFRQLAGEELFDVDIKDFLAKDNVDYVVKFKNTKSFTSFKKRVDFFYKTSNKWFQTNVNSYTSLINNWFFTWYQYYYSHFILPIFKFIDNIYKLQIFPILLKIRSWKFVDYIWEFGIVLLVETRVPIKNFIDRHVSEFKGYFIKNPEKAFWFMFLGFLFGLYVAYCFGDYLPDIPDLIDYSSPEKFFNSKIVKFVFYFFGPRRYGAGDDQDAFS